MKYKLVKEQQLSCDIDTAWKFFSSPHNLSKITPKSMGFVVLTKDLENQPIYEGLEIDYTVSPIAGIPMKWKTIITQVENKKSFTDFQKRGPYKYWNHYHEFLPNGQGVLMRDTVEYELPFGFLGDITHTLLVKKKLESIFDFRFKVLEQKFNNNI